MSIIEKLEERDSEKKKKQRDEWIKNILNEVNKYKYKGFTGTSQMKVF